MKNKQCFSTVKTSFNGGNLTNFSGIYPLFKFMKKMNLMHLFNNKISIIQKSNQVYSTGQVLQAIILGILSGMNRLIKIEYFTLDPLVQHLLSLDRKIDIDTIRHHLKQFGMRQNTELSDIIGKLSSKVHKKLATRDDILDLDSSVKTVYGRQEGARKGFNSQNKGKRSYHPQFAFLNSSKECLLAWLRPGDTHSVNNAAEFLKQALGLLPKGISRILVRGDSAYFDGKILDVLESKAHIRYLIKVRMRNMQDMLRRQEWDDIPGMEQWQMSEFYYRANNWNKARRFVALRKYEGMAESDSLFPVAHYSYYCYVSNIEESPLQLHRIYGDRGESENWIEAVKNQMYAAMMLTQGFWVNEALFLMSILAYNISIWMRLLSDKKAWRQEPLSFRLWFIQLAGKFTSSGRVKYLKMYSSYYYKSWWSAIDNKIDALTFT